MKKQIFVSLMTLGLFFGRSYAQEKIEPVDIQGDEINYVQETSTVVARGNVQMKYGDVQLFCDRAEYSSQEHTANIQGNVRIIRGDSVVEGQNVFYDFTTQNARIIRIDMSSPPMYGRAEEAEKIGQEKYLFRQGHVTTCDRKVPHYRLVAKRVTMYPGERVVARNMILKAGKIPLFYFPYFSFPLKDDSFPFQLSPGKDGDWGLYMLGRWRYRLQEQNKGKVHFDLYEHRGFGKGLTHKIETDDYGEALFNVYSIEDELYHRDKRAELFEEYPERRSLADKYLEDDRYKAQFSYSWDPTERLSIKSEFHKFSDEHFMKDFFEREYDVEPHPLSYTLIDYAFDNSSLALLTQKRANNFFTESEYLPQLEYNLFKQRMGDSHFYLESKSTLGNLSRKTARSSADDDALRIHSFNDISFVKNIDWLYVNPYVRTYTTFYSKNTYGDEGIFRVAPGTGLNLSTKLYKTYDASVNLFGNKAEQFRHILTPKLGYEYVNAPTVSQSHLPQFDSIDNLGRTERIVFTLDNKVQARREQKVWDFIYFSPSVTYQLHTPGKGSFFDTLTADLEIFPKGGISFTSDAEYDLYNEYFSSVNADVTFSDVEDKKYSVSLGHRYARNTSSQSTLGLTYQLMPKVQFRNYFRYEFSEDESKEQQYMFRFDLHCWWMDIGMDVEEDNDKTFWVIFKLKAFPDVHVGFDHTYEGAKDEY